MNIEIYNCRIKSVSTKGKSVKFVRYYRNADRNATMTYAMQTDASSLELLKKLVDDDGVAVLGEVGFRKRQPVAFIASGKVWMSDAITSEVIETVGRLLPMANMWRGAEQDGA